MVRFGILEQGPEPYVVIGVPNSSLHLKQDLSLAERQIVSGVHSSCHLWISGITTTERSPQKQCLAVSGTACDVTCAGQMRAASTHSATVLPASRSPVLARTG